MLTRRAVLVVLAGLAWSAQGGADEPKPVVVFDVEMINTSLERTTPAERERLTQLGEQLRAALLASGKYALVDMAPAHDKIAGYSGMRDCNGCELDIARGLGATPAVVGWVQKVSNLILNINVFVEDVATGERLKGGSVDIRGNTDESWKRGMSLSDSQSASGGIASHDRADMRPDRPGAIDSSGARTTIKGLRVWPRTLGARHPGGSS